MTDRGEHQPVRCNSPCLMGLLANVLDNAHTTTFGITCNIGHNVQHVSLYSSLPGLGYTAKLDEVVIRHAFWMSSNRSVLSIIPVVVIVLMILHS